MKFRKELSRAAAAIFVVALALGITFVGSHQAQAQAGPRSVEMRVFQVTVDPSTCIAYRFYIQSTSGHLWWGKADATCVDVTSVSIVKAATGNQTITGGFALINTGGFTGPVTGNVTGTASGSQNAQTVFSTGSSQAITVKTGTALLTKGTAGTYTLANPTAGTDDGKTLYLVSTTAAAHTVTTGTSGINGASHILTYGGAIGDGIVLEAYNGSWYVRNKTNITIT